MGVLRGACACGSCGCVVPPGFHMACAWGPTRAQNGAGAEVGHGMQAQHVARVVLCVSGGPRMLPSRRMQDPRGGR